MVDLHYLFREEGGEVISRVDGEVWEGRGMAEVRWRSLFAILKISPWLPEQPRTELV